MITNAALLSFSGFRQLQFLIRREILIDQALLRKLIQAALNGANACGGFRRGAIEFLQHFAKFYFLALIGRAALGRKTDAADRSFMLWHVLSIS